MKNDNKNITQADLNFFNTQKALFALDILFGIGLAYILSNIVMLFTNNAFLFGMIPLLLGMSLIFFRILRRYRRVRAYWDSK